MEKKNRYVEEIGDDGKKIIKKEKQFFRLTMSY